MPAVINVGKKNIADNKYRNNTVPVPPIVKLDSNIRHHIEKIGMKLNITGDITELNSIYPTRKYSFIPTDASTQHKTARARDIKSLVHCCTELNFSLFSFSP